MNVIHFVFGRPKQDTANGVLSAVDTLFSAQLASGAISPTVIGLLQPGKKMEVDSDGKRLFFPVTQFPFILPSKVIAYIKSLDSKNTVCHLHMVHIPIFFMLSYFLKRNNIRYVVSPHGGFTRNSLKNGRWKKLLFKLLFQDYINRNASKIIALSSSEKTEFEHYGIKAGDISIISNGLKVDKLVPLSARPRDENYVNICYLGRLDYWHKGLNILSAAFSKLPSIYKDKHLVLNLIGPDWNGGLEKLEQDFLSTDTIDRVKFHGPLFGKRKYDAMIGSDVFVLPSRNEGMPVSVIEAMGLGIPVVISRETNIPREAAEAGACLFVDLNADSLAKSLNTLLSDESLRKKMAICAYNYAVTSFSLDKVVDDYHNLFNTI